MTNNAIDFRGQGPDVPYGHHTNEDVHAGLVCSISVPLMDRARQLELFSIALHAIHGRDDLVNHCLEVTEDAEGNVSIILYELPRLHL